MRRGEADAGAGEGGCAERPWNAATMEVAVSGGDKGGAGGAQRRTHTHLPKPTGDPNASSCSAAESQSDAAGGWRWATEPSSRAAAAPQKACSCCASALLSAWSTLACTRGVGGVGRSLHDSEGILGNQKESGGGLGARLHELQEVEEARGPPRAVEEQRVRAALGLRAEGSHTPY